MDKKHFNFGSSIRDWYTQAFPDDELGYIIDPDDTFAGAVKFMAAGGEVYEYLGVVDSLVRENVFSKIAAITGVEYEDVYDLWLHHDASECSRLVFLGDHPDCAVDPDWRKGFDDVLGSAGRHVGFFTVSSRTSRNLAIISAPGEISLLSRRKRRENRAVRPARRIAIPKAHEGSQGVIECN